MLRLLRERDMLIQPFLSQVRCRGEICVVFVNGVLLHAIHKDPARWGCSDQPSESPPKAFEASRMIERGLTPGLPTSLSHMPTSQGDATTLLGGRNPHRSARSAPGSGTEGAQELARHYCSEQGVHKLDPTP